VLVSSVRAHIQPEDAWSTI